MSDEIEGFLSTEFEPVGETGEYRAATESAGLADLSSRTRIEMTGKDAVKFLHNLCTNDISKLEIGSGCEAFLLDPKGRVLDYVRIFRLLESLWLDAKPGRTKALMSHLDKYIIREDVSLQDRTNSHAQMHLLGPKAGEVLSRIIGEQVLNSQNLQHSNRTIVDRSCQLRRCDRSVGVGYDLLVSSEHAAEVCQVFQEAGRESALEPIGPGTLEILRIEAGLPEYGVDLDDQNIPQEVDRNEEAISFTKGCYIGQETVARLDAMGHVNKLLRGLILEAEKPCPTGSRIVFDGKEVGTLTSCVFSPKIGKPIGMTILRSKASKPGNQVTIESDSGTISAKVTELPFIEGL